MCLLDAVADIQSPANERIKALVRLRKRRERDKTGLFLVEGERELEAALPHAHVIEVYACEEALTGHARRVLGAVVELSNIPVVTVSRAALEKASLRGNPSGFVAVLEQWEANLSTVPTAEALLLVVESIEKPGNLGGMIRSANAAGASVIVADPTTDLFNSNVIRASMGTLFTTPVAVGTTSEVQQWLAARGVAVLATTPNATRPLWEFDLTGPCAFVVGSESSGLSPAWDGYQPVLIPMVGTIDSLNASVSAAICLFEAVRQRAPG
jgi:TrmH family RNA methyltransferase